MSKPNFNMIDAGLQAVLLLVVAGLMLCAGGFIGWAMLPVVLYSGWNLYRGMKSRGGAHEDERVQQIVAMSGHLSRQIGVLAVLALLGASLLSGRSVRAWAWPITLLLVLTFADAFFRWYFGLRDDADGAAAKSVRLYKIVGAAFVAIWLVGTYFVAGPMLESLGMGWSDVLFAARETPAVVSAAPVLAPAPASTPRRAVRKVRVIENRP